MSCTGEDIFRWRSSKRLTQGGLARLHNLKFKNPAYRLNAPIISLIENDILRPGPELARQFKALIGGRT